MGMRLLIYMMVQHLEDANDKHMLFVQYILITLTRSREWPSYYPRSHLLSGNYLLCLCLELVHIPVRPNQSTFEEFGLGASQPDHEVCRELSYEGKC